MLAAGALAAVALGYVWPELVRVAYASETREDEVLRAVAADGVGLSVTRYRPRAGAPRRAHPVLLVHGLASTRFNWDLGSGASFAVRLAELGWDTFVVELRGHGRSDGASILDGPGARRTFDAHLLLDVPAAAACVRAATGRDALHFVGHSMGGLLGYAALSTARGAFMRSCTVIGSSLDYSTSDSDFHLLVKLLPLSFLLPGLPFGTLGTATAPLALTVDDAVDRFNVWRTNVDRARFRRLLAVGFVNEPMSLLLSIASAVTGGGLLGEDGTRYADPAALARVRTPLLALASDRDRQCPFVAAHATFDLVGSTDKTLVKLGPEFGTVDHYGHVDMVSGLRAESESWPHVHAFLDAHD